MRRLLLAMLLVVAACGGGGDDDGDADATAATSSSTTTEVPTTIVIGGPGEAATTTAAPSAVEESSNDAAAEAPAAATAGPAPIPPGTYRYRQTGRTTAGPQSFDAPPEGKAVVDPPTAEPTQAVHRYIDPEGAPTDAYFRFASDGIFLYETVTTMGPTTIRCSFEPALATPAWPPTVGATSEASADCGSFTTNVTSKITGRTPVTMDGASYEAYVVETTITTEGDVVMTSTQIDHFVAELRLATHTETEAEGTYQGFEFSSRGTSDLVSAVPK